MKGRRSARKATEHRDVGQIGELTEKKIRHEGNAVRESYGTLEAPVTVGRSVPCSGS
jgi:hypothetical protein